MPSRKRLKSVCHSIAHHSVSGLSYLHPHALRSCRDLGICYLRFSLLSSDPCPLEFSHFGPLRSALRTLSDTFREILGSEGFTPDSLTSATMLILPDNQCLDDHCTTAHCEITTTDGAHYESAVNYMGHSVHVPAVAREARVSESLHT
jgi:hypothetical protein